MTQTTGDDPRLAGASSRQAEVLAAVTERGMIRVTELAAELGVTPVTVRRAVGELADAGLVRRVHGGATAVGPRPSTAARRTGTWPVAGSAVGSGSAGMLVPSLDYYWPDVARGAEEEAQRLGLRVTLRGSVYHAPDERGDVQRLIDAGARGLLMAPTLRGAGGELMREWLAEAPVPVVLMERTAAVGGVRRSVESVITDHADGTAMAVHHLVGLGHRRVGVALSKDSPHVQQIRAGWRATCDDHSLDSTGVVDRSIPDRRQPDFEDAIDSIIDEVAATGTTALLVHSDPEAIRLIQRAEERGISVPGDLSVVSYDDQVAAMTAPALTAVRPPRRTIGRTAVGLLAARMADPGRPVHRVLVSPTLMVRDSSGPPSP
ncbi:LacI family DNA-binding transcriptional regulator [Ruania halotolerans]|uniref:LacI family DNA-binding transcriptional regulator n=1 Tax=Ruania halotolerans TaxID=2897773 RepID=UPI001E614915|nr:LacI family DNA-binding transcriptional regulator [Ruania halotolerans]UFU06776.1 LacI family transcriptional regulator [Ruania halotolerans]